MVLWPWDPMGPFIWALIWDLGFLLITWTLILTGWVDYMAMSG